MKIGLKHIKKYLILIPFFLITVSEIISFSNHFVGSILKLSAVVFMLAYVLGHGKFEIKLFLTFLIFIPILLYHIKISFNLNAAKSYYNSSNLSSYKSKLSIGNIG